MHFRRLLVRGFVTAFENSMCRHIIIQKRKTCRRHCASNPQLLKSKPGIVSASLRAYMGKHLRKSYWLQARAALMHVPVTQRRCCHSNVRRIWSQSHIATSEESSVNQTWVSSFVVGIRKQVSPEEHYASVLRHSESKVPRVLRNNIKHVCWKLERQVATRGPLKRMKRLKRGNFGCNASRTPNKWGRLAIVEKRCNFVYSEILTWLRAGEHIS